MRVKLTGYVRHNGARHKPGSVLSLSDDEAKRLIGLRAAVAVEEAPPKPPLTPDDPETLAAASVRELEALLPSVTSREVLQKAMEFEQAKEQPRSTVIAALEKRLAELAHPSGEKQ